MIAGKITVDLVPQGTLIERMMSYIDAWVTLAAMVAAHCIILTRPHALGVD